jgi:NADPH-dependent ferric siderophore reductase
VTRSLCEIWRSGSSTRTQISRFRRSSLVWLHRSGAEQPGDLLVDAVAALDWPAGRADVFVHGEAGEVRTVRRHLIAERGIDRETASISPYWRRGQDDEAWRQVKNQWIADQEADV